MRKISVLSLILPLVVLPSCKIHESFSRADLIGFSADVQPSYHVEEGPFKNLEPQSAPYDLLANEEGFGELLEDVRTGDNTTLYYATDVAIDRIKYVRTKVAKRDPETLYYIFIISDGLDNASVSVSHNHRQTTFISRPDIVTEVFSHIVRHQFYNIGSASQKFVRYMLDGYVRLKEILLLVHQFVKILS